MTPAPNLGDETPVVRGSREWLARLYVRILVSGCRALEDGALCPLCQEAFDAFGFQWFDEPGPDVWIRDPLVKHGE